MTDFDYNNMYKKYFRVYENCKRKYNFTNLSAKEYQQIVIEITKVSLKENDSSDDYTFKLVLRDALNKALDKVMIKRLQEDQYLYLNNYFTTLDVNQPPEKIINILKKVIKQLNIWETKISSVTAIKLISTNANVAYITQQYSLNVADLKDKSIFKDYNLNTLLFYYNVLKNGDSLSVNSFSKSSNQNENKLISEPVSFQKIDKSIFQIFSYYDPALVQKAYSYLDDESKKFLRKQFAEHLEPIKEANINYKESIAIKIIIYERMSNILKVLSNQRSSFKKNNLFYRYRDYSKKEIFLVIKNLNFDDQAIMNLYYDAYGYLKNTYRPLKIDKALKKIIYVTIPQRLKKLRIHYLTEFLDLYYRNAYRPEQIEEALTLLGTDFQNDLYKTFELEDFGLSIKNSQLFAKLMLVFDDQIRKVDIKDILIEEIKQFWGIYSDELIVVLLMRLEQSNKKDYSKEAISALLKISLANAETDMLVIEKLVNRYNGVESTNKKTLKMLKN